MMRLVEIEDIKRVKEVNAAITRVTQMIAHDIRRPISLMGNYIDQMQEQFKIGDAKSDQENNLEQICSARKGADQLIHDLLSIDAKPRLILGCSDLVTVIKRSVSASQTVMARMMLTLKFRDLPQFLSM